MLILQNFNISMHLIKHHLKNQCLSLLLQLTDGMRTLDDFEEEKALLAILLLSL